MDKPVFLIPQKKYTGETTIASMRIARELLQQIDRAASLTGRTRNEILTMSLEFALSHMEMEDKQQQTP